MGHCWDSTWYVKPPQTPLTHVIDCGLCNYMCVCLRARDSGSEAVCGPLCVRVHIEVCLCVTFSVSIFLGSSDGRVM